MRGEKGSGRLRMWTKVLCLALLCELCDGSVTKAGQPFHPAIVNTTAPDLEEFEPWIEEQPSLLPDVYVDRPWMLATPVRTMITTMLLPTVALLAVFLFVEYYSEQDMVYVEFSNSQDEMLSEDSEQKTEEYDLSI